MKIFAQTCEAIAATTKKTEKVRLVAEYLRGTTTAEAMIAARYLSGRIFPAYAETTLQVGGAMLWQALKEVSDATDIALTAAYRKHGDLGAAAFEVLTKQRHAKSGGAAVASLKLLDVQQRFAQMAETRRAAMKVSLVRELLERASALEAKYLIKLIAGELRIGLRESLVEEAIAQAFGSDGASSKAIEPTESSLEGELKTGTPKGKRAAGTSIEAKRFLKNLQRANMLLGDMGEALRLSSEGKLAEARMRLFHPLGFMLATPAQDAAEAFAEFDHAEVEDKYDGVRAQAHIGPVAENTQEWRARLFSRTLDEITESFPELPPALASFSDAVVLDGEIVAWSHGGEGTGTALPFSALQKRLGRKRVTREQMQQVPVVYVAFDVLYAGGDLTIDKPLQERAALLDALFASARKVEDVPLADPQGALVFEPAVQSPVTSGEPRPRVLRAPVTRADSPEELDRLFAAAQARGNEGLMIKDLESAYTPGRRGRSWLKMKRELATLDVVVTAVEYGHGKRVGVLSDYTFAVRATEASATVGEEPTPLTPSGDVLLNVGKAYSGLTDAEITEMTEWFLEHTVADRGFRRIVEPKIVIEVAFNNVMISDRHNSGFALRFPRIVRLRSDKSPDEADTLERVSEIYGKQAKREIG